MAAAAAAGVDFSAVISHPNSSESTTPMSDNRSASGVPKFRSLPPPSLPISPSSSSSWFTIPPGLSPSELLDSPILLSGSNVLPSPTTGSFPVGSLDGKSSFDWLRQEELKQQQSDDTQDESNTNSFSDFTFPAQNNQQLPTATDYGSTTLWGYDQTQAASNNNRVEEESSDQKQDFNSSSDQGFSPDIASIQANHDGIHGEYNNNNSSGASKRKLDDGYNWRKYGQKQVKGRENPRSYYKCTYPNCPTKKKVETCVDGPIAEIIYKGTHSHPKPHSTRRSSTSSCYSHLADISDTKAFSSTRIPKMDSWSSVITSDNTSTLPGDDFEQSHSGKDDLDDEEPDPKRWKNEVETDRNSSVSGGSSRAVREPRVVVQTTSDIDVLDDGFRWRKYGQKVVKGNPNPRSYYKCTANGCPVREHVERSSHDHRAVITTYEGRHNHEVPATRGSGVAGSHSVTRPLPYNPYNATLGMGNGALMLFPDNSKVQATYTLDHIQSVPKTEPGDDDFMNFLLC